MSSGAAGGPPYQPAPHSLVLPCQQKGIRVADVSKRPKSVNAVNQLLLLNLSSSGLGEIGKAV